MAENPLLSDSFRIPFRELRPEHVVPGIAEAIRRAEARLAALLSEPVRSFENTLLALEEVQELVGRPANLVGHLVAVESSDELRAAHNVVEPQITAFFSGLTLSDELYAAVRAFAATEEGRALTGPRRRFLEKVLGELEDEGAGLPPEAKERVRAIASELAAITTRYTEHVLDATNAFELVLTSEAELAGLPPSAIAAARESARSRGLGSDAAPAFRFTLHQPSYLPVLTFADDPKLRERMHRARGELAAAPPHDNLALVPRILELRAEKARLIGRKDWAELVLARRMAKDGATALRFVTDLTERTRPAFERETEELRRFRREHGDGRDSLEPWDLAYWAEKQRAALFSFDEEELRPYFPLPAVMSGLFEIVRRLYGVTVRELPEPAGWHDEVRLYELRDEAGVHLGSFYADWHPRESKRGGAWMNHLITGGPDAGGRHQPHLGLVCGNLTPPLGSGPALLTHAEVETVFHEVGHLLHHVLSRVPIRSLAGTNVAWDFVELPSQIMENWCWEPEALALFAAHHETGAPLPAELLSRKLATRRFRAASAQLRQLAFATVDLSLHLRFDSSRDGDLNRYANELLARFQPQPPAPGSAFVASFSHVFGSPVGYSTAYYSYKWAEVLEADAFTRFQREGVLSRATGKEFLEKLLARGDSEDPMKLYVAFVGRPPDQAALLARSGLTPLGGQEVR